MKKINIIVVLFLLLGISFAIDELNPEGKYCFSYTWLGPDFTATVNEDEEEMKCADYLTIDNTTNTPCVEPLIFSEDTISKPDPNELWETNMTAVACRKSDIQSCATYTVSFNGLVTYQSHMCTRVRTKTEVIRTGCLTEKRNNMDIQVCVCESEKGLNIPCNRAPIYSVSAYVIFLGSFITWMAHSSSKIFSY